eukprot:s135_g14.t1
MCGIHCTSFDRQPDEPRASCCDILPLIQRLSLQRWSGLISIAIAARRAFASSLLELPLDSVACAAGDPALHKFSATLVGAAPHSRADSPTTRETAYSRHQPTPLSGLSRRPRALAPRIDSRKKVRGKQINMQLSFRTRVDASLTAASARYGLWFVGHRPASAARGRRKWTAVSIAIRPSAVDLNSAGFR